MNNKQWRMYIILLALWFCAFVLSSCSGEYWQGTDRNGYTRFTAAWGSSPTCATYHNLPTKKSTYNRQAYNWRR